jgi:hypothetical protein
VSQISAEETDFDDETLRMTNPQLLDWEIHLTEQLARPGSMNRKQQLHIHNSKDEEE